VFGRPVARKDAVPEARLRRAERRLGFRLPDALRDYLALAGLAKENREHNRLFRPEELAVEDGYLLFMEENQAVVHWGVPVGLLEKSDPEVWQRVNGDRPEWYSEEMRFSEFMIKNLAWQRGVDQAGRPRDAINPPSLFRSLEHGFSQAVVASGRRTLYVSGQTAWDARKHLVGGADLETQARQAFANLRTVVEAAGATLADVVSVRIYVVDYRPDKAGPVGRAFTGCFSGPIKPACTWIGVAALADPGFLIEVEATAVFD
jgi:enamine deaminase RidA (YjgF/YER057c/UK114 family)